MQFDIDTTTRRQGRAPHELAMVNLLVFNLLFCMAVLAGTVAQKGSVLEHYKAWTIAVPLGLSLAVIAYSFWRAAQARAGDPWFAAAHWLLATGRYRILMIAYLVGAALVGLGWLLSLSNPKLQELMFIALVRVAVAPMLISVMVLAVLESSALAQAGNGEVPDSVVKRMPPPADLVTGAPANPPAAGGA
jgi:hypothetical protein